MNNLHNNPPQHEAHAATIRELRIEADLAREIIETLALDNLQDDDEAIEMSLESETDFVGAIERVLIAKLDDDAMCAAIDQRIDNLKLRKERLTVRALRHIQAIEQALSLAGLKSVSTPSGTVFVAGGRPKLVITAESSIPEEYISVTIARAPDKKALLDALKAGQTIAGVQLGKTEPTLTIRRT